MEDVTLADELEIALEPTGVLRNGRGVVRLGTASRAHVEGDPDTSMDVTGLGAASDAAAFQHATLLNVRLPTTVDSLVILQAFEPCHRFTPVLHDPPSYRELDPSEAAHQAAHYERLGELAATRHADGPTRAEINWRTYRLRHRAASNWLERTLLRLYWLLGYGHRPGPPFRVLLGLAFVGASCHQGWTRSWELELTAGNVTSFALAFLSTFLAPINLARSVGGWMPNGPEGVAYSLILVLASVAFGAMLYALRQYVRVRT